jgi:hypothetical protein
MNAAPESALAAPSIISVQEQSSRDYQAREVPQPDPERIADDTPRILKLPFAALGDTIGSGFYKPRPMFFCDFRGVVCL